LTRSIENGENERMKKLILILAGVVVLVVVAAVVGVGLFLDEAIKKGVETYAPQYTQTPVKIDAVALSALSGSGSIKGFVMGNPAGYKTPYAMQVGSASLAVKPASLFPGKVIFHSIVIQNPEINFEGDLAGNNLNTILKNVQAASAGTASSTNAPASSGTTKKLQVDEFVLTGGKVQLSTSLLGGRATMVQLPDIRLSGLGTGPDGITGAELTQRAIRAITDAAKEAVQGALAREAQERLTKAVGTNIPSAGQLREATRGLGDLLKKK
jgi:uncharacterized protein involved in outer membrane biogenesis